MQSHSLPLWPIARHAAVGSNDQPSSYSGNRALRYRTSPLPTVKKAERSVADRRRSGGRTLATRSTIVDRRTWTTINNNSDIAWSNSTIHVKGDGRSRFFKSTFGMAKSHTASWRKQTNPRETVLASLRRSVQLDDLPSTLSYLTTVRLKALSTSSLCCRYFRTVR